MILVVRALHPATHAATERHQQSGVHGHQVGAADDGLGHVFGQGDAARNDQRDLVAHAGLD
jgi:hypothetical protein